jgi:hypothetical protein
MTVKNARVDGYKKKARKQKPKKRVKRSRKK